MSHLFAGLLRTVTLAGILLLAAHPEAYAVSWQWSVLPGRERITVDLDRSKQEQGTSRVGSTLLEVALSTPPAGLTNTGAQPSADSLVAGLSADGAALHVRLRDAAFGYLVTRPTPKRLIIDVFADPLGTRWSRPGMPAPASAPSRSASAKPEPPAVPEVPEVPRPQKKASAPASEPVRSAPQAAPTNTPAANTAQPKTMMGKMAEAAQEASPQVQAPILPREKAGDSTARQGTRNPFVENEPQASQPQEPVAGEGQYGRSIGAMHGTLRKDVSNAKPEPLPEPKPEKSTETPEPTAKPGDNAGSSSAPSAATASDPSRPSDPAAGQPYSLRAQLNAQGPENWPQEKGLSTSIPEPVLQDGQSTAEAAPEKGKAGTQEVKKAEEAAQERPVVYVDEEGNTVPKPPDSPAMIAEAKALLKAKAFEEALPLLQEIKQHVLTPPQREDVLYMLMQATKEVYKDRWLEGYEPIVVAASEAMNFNLRSPRVAEALLTLGNINLHTGNQEEAAGYFGALRNGFPLDPEVPSAFLALGKDQFQKGQYADATRTFQEILDKHPESPAVRDASRYMAEALFKQGHNRYALVLVDFVARRWPRLHLDDPSFLVMVSDLYLQEGRLGDALQTYWLYYNLLPENPDNHKLLLQIGSIYLQQNQIKAARDVFGELLRKYPKTDSAPVAVRRLGEEAIVDGNPDLDALLAFFGRPRGTSPDIAYRRVLQDYPDSQEAILAALRLAAWTFWDKDVNDAMQQAKAFVEKHPSSPYAPRAEELLQRGFAQQLDLAQEEGNYERVLALWETYPEVQLAYAQMPDPLRVALARAQLNRGNEAEGMKMLEAFLTRPAKDPVYGEYVYKLFLARALRTEDWNGVLDLGEKVAGWDLPAELRGQLDYACAISSENMGMGAKALPLWNSLHKQTDLPLYQRAYASYFLAREAERQRDIEAAYNLNLETLKLFTTLEEERSDKADPERIRESLAALMDVTEVANRYAEALDWAAQYARFVPEESPDYAGLRFREARLHRKMGDQQRWKAILEEIIRREPESVFGRMAASELRTQEVARDLSRFTPQE